MLSKTLILTAFLGFVASNPLTISDFKMVEGHELDSSNHITIESLGKPYDAKNNQLFADRNNFIYVKDTKSVIVHKSKLDTAWRTGGVELQSPEEIKKDKHTWKQFKLGTFETVSGERRALTGCLDQTHGSGGSLSGSFSSSIGETGTYTLTAGYSYLLGKLNGEFSPSQTASVGISGSYSCSVGNGTVGQILIEPYVVQLEKAKSRDIIVQKGKTWGSPFSSTVKEVAFGSWYSQKGALVPSFQREPLLLCVNGEDVMCEAEVVGETISLSRKQV